MAGNKKGDEIIAPGMWSIITIDHGCRFIALLLLLFSSPNDLRFIISRPLFSAVLQLLFLGGDLEPFCFYYVHASWHYYSSRILCSLTCVSIQLTYDLPQISSTPSQVQKLACSQLRQ